MTTHTQAKMEFSGTLIILCRKRNLNCLWSHILNTSLTSTWTRKHDNTLSTTILNCFSTSTTGHLWDRCSTAACSIISSGEFGPCLFSPKTSILIMESSTMTSLTQGVTCTIHLKTWLRNTISNTIMLKRRIWNKNNWSSRSSCSVWRAWTNQLLKVVRPRLRSTKFETIGWPKFAFNAI